MQKLFTVALDPHSSADLLTAWRQHTLQLLLKGFFLLIVPMLLINAATQLWIGRWQLASVHIGVTVGVMLVSRTRPHDYLLRGKAIVALFMVTGLYSLYAIGNYSITLGLIFVTAVLAVLLLERRDSIAVITISLLGVAAIMIGFGSGLIAYPYAEMRWGNTWPAVINTIVLTTGITLLLAMMVSSLVLSLRASLQATRSARDELAQLNSMLETTVAERTAALKRSQTLLQSVLDYAPVAIYVKDHEGRYVLLNRYMETLYPDTSLIGQRDRDHFGAAAEPWRMQEQQVREQQQALVVELEVPQPAATRYYYAVKFPIVGSSSDEVLVGNIALDVTERKTIEMALATQLRYAEALADCSRILLRAGSNAPHWEPIVEAALRTLREAAGCTRIGLNMFHTPEGSLHFPASIVADHDPAGSPFQYVAVGVADLPPTIQEQVRVGAFVSGRVDELFAPTSAAYTFFSTNQLYAVLLGGVHINDQWRGFIAASDTCATFDWNEPLRQMIRTGLEMITVFLSQWETAQALRTQEVQLRAVGDNLPNGFIYQYRLDAALYPTFTYLSSGVEQVLGVLPEAGLANASALNSLIAPEEQERSLQAVLVSRANVSVFAEILRYVRADGSERWLYISSRPRPADAGSVIWDGVALDITERQRAAAELARARDAAEAATRAKSAFLANMSHEIRTPLNAVLGMAALLKESALSADQQTLVATIQTGGEALLAVISDILDFSRIESGHVALDPQPFDLPLCLQSTLDLITHSAQQKGLQVVREIPPDLPQMVVGDASRLRQVILNLLSNAVKFTPRGTITFAVAAEALSTDCELHISVRDTGIGMSTAQIAQIFEPFIQADRSTSRRYGGTGLGLAICRQLVTLMGGTISVSSELGRGTTFAVQLELPVVARITPAPELPTPTGSARCLHILVAEDNPVNQKVIERMLVRQGHRVTLVSDGQAALAALEQGSYDAVLMDVQMPLLDGEAVTRQIRARGSAVVQPYIIALTANAMAGDRERYLASGMNAYLSKPVLPAVLHAALAQVP